MPTLPGFGGRIGRLAFLGWSLALAAASMVLTLVLVFALVPRGHPAGAASGGIVAVIAIVVPFFLYGSLSLQARRLRDIGWSPGLTIGAWMSIELVDMALAHAVPALARAGGGTGLGAIVNFVLSVALIFKPGQPEDSGRGGGYHHPEPPARSRALPTERTAPPRAMPQTAPVVAGFGRRGL